MAVAWMWESQFEGMEELPTERRQFGFIDMKMSRCSIESVSDERVFSGRETYSNLMRAAGVELDKHEAGGGQNSEVWPVRERSAHPARGGAPGGGAAQRVAA